LFGFGNGAAAGEVGANYLLAALVEDVGAAFQEEHAEDVFLELGGVHLAAEDVGGGEEVAFELREGEFAHVGAYSGCPLPERQLGGRNGRVER
jgi:hypothetical protein